MTVDIIIYHNPECGTTRNTLAIIQTAGIEPHIIEYLKTPRTARGCLAARRQAIPPLRRSA